MTMQMLNDCMLALVEINKYQTLNYLEMQKRYREYLIDRVFKEDEDSCNYHLEKDDMY